MNRAAFFRRLALGTGGLIVGDRALELFAQLTHSRKSFPSAAIARPSRMIFEGNPRPRSRFIFEWTAKDGMITPAGAPEPLFLRRSGMAQFTMASGVRSMAEMRSA